jgi:AcrR family transcriptional regulator
MARQAQAQRKQRRRPVQRRSQQTSLAIRDAFVRLLNEKPYERLTIREIVMVAGVGLGTFYEYFDSKDDLARTAVHLRTKALLHALRRARAELCEHDLATGVGAGVGALISLVAQAPREWSQHFLMERQKTDLKYYRAAYELFVEEWRRIVAGATDWPQASDSAAAARVSFTLVYGLLSHALLRDDGPPDLDSLRQDLGRAAIACLAVRQGR